MNKKVLLAFAILAIAVTPSVAETVQAFEEGRSHRTLILGWYVLVFLLALLVWNEK